MTRLVEALQTLGLKAETGPSGRWVRFRSRRATVYVLQAPWSDDYFVWCDPPIAGAPESYRDPQEALRAGIMRSADLAE